MHHLVSKRPAPEVPVSESLADPMNNGSEELGDKAEGGGVVSQGHREYRVPHHTEEERKGQAEPAKGEQTLLLALEELSQLEGR